jgi:benzoyl-CoA reductase/2-hydroxyglutaryl-CoA dehydratase subunit BcrC/BadD/HgdB
LLIDKLLGIKPDGSCNEHRTKRRLRIVRAVMKMLKPLLRFEGLFSYFQRNQIMIMSSNSMTPEFWYAMLPGQAVFRNILEQSVVNREQSDKPVVWLEWCLSTDLIFAFDALPIIPETLIAAPLMMVGLEPIETLIDIAEQAGVPQEYCSASRSAIGAVLTEQYPKPDCIVTVSHPCDSMVSSYQTMEYLTGVPTYRLDTPYWDDQRSLDYYAQDVWALIGFLEKQLNRRLDFDRLREILEEVNQTNELLTEINEMSRSVPCPSSGFVFLLTWLVREGGRGTPEVTEMARRLHTATRKRVESGQGAVKKEKIRIIWFDVPIAFYPLIAWMEEKFGAVVVVDLVGFVDTPPIDTRTPESMVRGLAASYMNLTMARQFHGPLELYHRDVKRICQEYKGDCFICAGHAGCKHGWASVRLLKEEMKKIGMPLLVLTSDIFDMRLTNEAKLKEQIEEFFITNGLA